MGASNSYQRKSFSSICPCLFYCFLAATACGVFSSYNFTPQVNSKGKGLRTKNVIIVVIDGPRYAEMWGNTPGLIPNMSTMLKQSGSYLSNFQNDGYTYTNSGHAAITTGVNQPIDNYGDEFPANPSIFQYWLKKTNKPATAAWIISSKDKLHILANTQDSLWRDKYLPSINCGINGPGTGYRADSLTLLEAKRILTAHRPSLVLINFMEPDGYAHAGNWNYYLRGISRNDRYVKELWDLLNQDNFYRKKTTLLITNDHGRHLNGVAEGWQEHGDTCEGCRHISLLALGPDFRKGAEISRIRTLVDIAPTVGRLLRFKMNSKVVVPRLDTTVVALTPNTPAEGLRRDSLVVVTKMERSTLKGQVIEELFMEGDLP